MKGLLKTYTISISGSVISLKLYLYYYLEQSTSSNLTSKIPKQKKKLSIICWYVEIHSAFLLNQSCNLELHLVKKKRHTHTIEIECYSK
jgi:hypothetical protein